MTRFSESHTTVKKVKTVPSQNILQKLKSNNMAPKMVGLACISPLMLLLMNLNPSMPPSMLLLLSMPLLTNHRPNLVSSVRRNSATWAQPLLPKKLGVLKPKRRKVVDHIACLPQKSTKVAIASNLATKSMLRMKFSIRLMNSTLIIHPPNSYHLRTSTKLL